MDDESARGLRCLGESADATEIHDPIELLDEVEDLLERRHHAAPSEWDALSDALSEVEDRICALPEPQLRSALDLLLRLLHRVVEEEGLANHDGV